MVTAENTGHSDSVTGNDPFQCPVTPPTPSGGITRNNMLDLLHHFSAIEGCEGPVDKGPGDKQVVNIPYSPTLTTWWCFLFFFTTNSVTKVRSIKLPLTLLHHSRQAFPQLRSFRSIPPVRIYVIPIDRKTRGVKRIEASNRVHVILPSNILN